MFHGGLSTKAHDISIQTRVQHSDDYWCGPSLCVAVDEVGGAREKKVWTCIPYRPSYVAFSLSSIHSCPRSFQLQKHALDSHSHLPCVAYLKTTSLKQK